MNADGQCRNGESHGLSMSAYLLRNPAFVCVSRRDSYYFLRPDGSAIAIPSTDVAQVSAAMMRLALPTSREVVSSFVDADTLAFFITNGIVLEGDESELSKQALWSRPTARPCTTLVFCVTGAVAAIHTPSLVYDLFHNFAETIEVVLSEPAHMFVTPDIFPRLGIRVWTDFASPHGDVNVPHIHLANAAHLVVVWPTSAHTLYKLAHGACSDLTSLIVAATRAPVVLVPAMNHAMWSHHAVVRNVGQVRRDGCYVIEPRGGIEVANRQQGVQEYGNPGLDLFGLRRVLTAILDWEASRVARETERTDSVAP